jgi:hypothetical protein
VSALFGCAITYVDRETGATNTFGLLHVTALPRPAVGQPLDVVDVSSFGIALKLNGPGSGLVIGYDRSQLVRSVATEGGSILISNGVVTCIAADQQCVQSLAAFNSEK